MDPETCRSRAGSLVMLAGAAVYWTSKLQDSVAISTMEAEYQAQSITARDVMALRQLLPCLGGDVAAPTVIYTDSENALAHVNSHMTTVKSKHIRIAHHYARERVMEGELKFVKVPTKENLADALTKPVEATKLEFCRNGFGLIRG
jgi:hypothetical protein